MDKNQDLAQLFYQLRIVQCAITCAEAKAVDQLGTACISGHDPAFLSGLLTIQLLQ
jgi:hypothetical protein